MLIEIGKLDLLKYNHIIMYILYWNNDQSSIRVLYLYNQLEVLFINYIKYKLYSSNFKNIKIYYYSRFQGIRE